MSEPINALMKRIFTKKTDHCTVRLVALLAIFTFSASCNDGDAPPNVKEVSVDFTSRRFDRDFAILDTSRLSENLVQLAEKYPDFIDFYLDTLLALGIQQQYARPAPKSITDLKEVLTFPDYSNLNDTIAAHFPDTKQLDEDLEKGFRYYKHYFPQGTIPKIIYLSGYLNAPAAFIKSSNVVGVSLDMYLGKDYRYYPSVGIPDYATAQCRPGFVCVNVFKVLYEDSFPFEKDNKNLLQMMLQKGKEQYYLEKVLPFTEDTTRMGFTKAQLNWCESNEVLLYNAFVSQGLLYDINLQKTLRYMMDGPSASGFGDESPGNVGMWMGYRIVKQFMKENPETTLEQLFPAGDAQQFLMKAKYAPR